MTRFKMVRDETGRIGSRTIDKTPGALTYDVTFLPWDSYVHAYLGTIFPRYRAGRTRLAGWEVTGSDARFKTLDAAADFLVLRHLSDQAMNVKAADPVEAGIAKATQEMMAAGSHKTGGIPFAIGYVTGLAKNVKDAPLALPEYASGPYCAVCGDSVVGNDDRYFRPGAGYFDGKNLCSRHHDTEIRFNNPAWATCPGWNALPWGREPNPERTHLTAMAERFDRTATDALDVLASLAPVAVEMARGIAPRSTDGMLDLADSLYHAADEMGHAVRCREQCFIRLGDLPMTASDIADYMGDQEPEYPDDHWTEVVADPMLYEPYPVAEYYGAYN